MSDAICPCGAVLEPSVGRPRKFCSRKCNRTFHYRRPPRTEDEKCSVDGCTRSRAAKGMCLSHRSAVTRRKQAAEGIKRNRYLDQKIACAYEPCGREHWVQSGSPTQFCSLTCSQRSRYPARSRELVIYTGPPFVRKPKINKNPIPKRDGRFKSGACKACGAWFIALNNDANCSDKCQKWWKKNSPCAIEGKRLGRDRRRARKKDAFVENVYRKKIYARDDYRCQLRLPGCKGVDLNKVVPHPKAPTLDHIVPLAAGVAAGGTHEPKNCQLACFQCNWKKSDGGGGEQLLLIG